MKNGDNMVERVARAMADRAEISSRHQWPGPDHPDWPDLARAAIAETGVERLRQQREILWLALNTIAHRGGEPAEVARDALMRAAMIDAALKEDGK